MLFTTGEIVPCDIDKRVHHLCVLCCCGVETNKTTEHLASAAHVAQRALACLPPGSQLGQAGDDTERPNSGRPHSPLHLPLAPPIIFDISCLISPPSSFFSGN
ncbi:hypothetical protein PAPYR_528 [Paratrimastix pyriformis]|uniref:Uncharacterized protein n=1 Tax=Paratrimastix pyriformis TaxID=342808 RepID=A0ABQ8UTU5_9EUKA|nr:hypothetical protein PAPYR_528 [Paratrimastix pyriformis]